MREARIPRLSGVGDVRLSELNNKEISTRIRDSIIGFNCNYIEWFFDLLRRRYLNSRYQNLVQFNILSISDEELSFEFYRSPYLKIMHGNLNILTKIGTLELYVNDPIYHSIRLYYTDDHNSQPSNSYTVYCSHKYPLMDFSKATTWELIDSRMDLVI